eukprot:gene166-4412_t
MKKLSYEIHYCSSHLGVHTPENILVDDSFNQASRWTPSSRNEEEIILKLENISKIESIKFFKFYKLHSNNMKEFKISVGLNSKFMKNIFYGELKNNENDEMIPLNSSKPIQYIKISPISSYNETALPSIFHIELFGTENIKEDLNLINKESVKLCLKYLRENNYLSLYKDLEKQSGIKLENDILTKIHETFVVNGDFDKTEEYIFEIKEIFNSYIENSKYSYQWNKIEIQNSNVPCERSGSSMCIDEDNSIIYLFGGWTGECELNDFWCFNINKKEWKEIKNENGPSVRSCHLMSFYKKKRYIYFFGRYADIREEIGNKSTPDFYYYDLNNNTFNLISLNTSLEGGPLLISGHQMIIKNDKLYIHGGRNIQNEYSELYIFDLIKNEWSFKKNITSRISHGMILTNNDKLYCFGGKKKNFNIFLNNYEIFDLKLDYNIIKKSMNISNSISNGNSNLLLTFNENENEIYFFNSLMNHKINLVQNTFYILNLKNEKWEKIFTISEPFQNEFPTPRAFHNFIYDEKNKVHYIFGGNAGENLPVEKRLGDFWSLSLFKITLDEILNEIKFIIRKQKYIEMSMNLNNSFKSLEYFKDNLSNHIKNKDQIEKLLIHLLKPINENEIYKTRMNSYEDILKYFPNDIKQPNSNISDIICE